MGGTVRMWEECPSLFLGSRDQDGSLSARSRGQAASCSDLSGIPGFVGHHLRAQGIGVDIVADDEGLAVGRSPSVGHALRASSLSSPQTTASGRASSPSSPSPFPLLPCTPLLPSDLASSSSLAPFSCELRPLVSPPLPSVIHATKSLPNNSPIPLVIRPPHPPRTSSLPSPRPTSPVPSFPAGRAPLPVVPTSTPMSASLSAPLPPPLLTLPLQPLPPPPTPQLPRYSPFLAGPCPLLPPHPLFLLHGERCAKRPRCLGITWLVKSESDQITSGGLVVGSLIPEAGRGSHSCGDAKAHLPHPRREPG
jgi:hypothetical protein